jgi:hypothetical protein
MALMLCVAQHMAGHRNGVNLARRQLSCNQGCRVSSVLATQPGVAPTQASNISKAMIPIRVWKSGPCWKLHK